MSSDAPRVTVIVPAYNAEATLDQCISSVRAQTLSSWELLISNDGSTDATQAVAERWAGVDTRIRVLRYCNGGVSTARNRAAAFARGEFLAFLDADDRWHREKLSRQLDYLDSTPEAGTCFTRASFISSHGKSTGTLSAALVGRVEPHCMLYGNPATTCSTVMTRRRVFHRVGGFDAELRFAEDLEWLLRAACNSGLEVHALACPLTDYRCSPKGLSSQLESMHHGWEAMVGKARRYAPSLIAAHESAARAAHLGYLARRAVRLGHPFRIASRYLRRSVLADPRIVLREPRRLILTLAASCALPLLSSLDRKDV